MTFTSSKLNNISDQWNELDRLVRLACEYHNTAMLENGLYRYESEDARIVTRTYCHAIVDIDEDYIHCMEFGDMETIDFTIPIAWVMEGWQGAIAKDISHAVASRDAESLKADRRLYKCLKREMENLKDITKHEQYERYIELKEQFGK